MSLFAELKRRNVIRMAGLYLVGAWLLTQVASTVFPAFGVPAWALRALILLLVLGFPLMLIFSWVSRTLATIGRTLRAGLALDSRRRGNDGCSARK